MRKLLLIIVLAIGAALPAQDIHFTQYYAAPQFINPAAFGTANSLEAGLLYKTQWQSFTKGYTTYGAFVNKQLRGNKFNNRKKGYFSAGLSFFYDKAGSTQLTTINANLPVNYTVRLNKTNLLTSGLYVGFGQRSINVANSTWGNQFDGYQYNSALPTGEPGATQVRAYLDLGIGMTLTSGRKVKTIADINDPKNVIGISAAHLNRPRYSFYGMPDERLRMRFNLYEYHHFYFRDSPYSLIPSLMVQYQANAYEVVMGTFLRYRIKTDARITGFKKSSSASLGLFYRVGDAMSLNGMFEMNRYTIGVAYDLNLSNLRVSTRMRGGVEIYLKLNDPFNYLYRGFSKF